MLNNPLNNVDPDGLDSITASTPGFDMSGHPTTSGGSASGTLGFGGSGFGFSWGGGVPKVMTISAPHLPYANGPLDVFVGGAKQAAYDAVDSLSRFANGDHPTEATNWLLWQLRPTTQKQQAGANILGLASVLGPLGEGRALAYSTTGVATAAREIEAGATSITVGSKSEAEELFLRLFQGDSRGYRNTTGWTGKQVRDFYGEKAGTYHWDTTAGHGPNNPHGALPHLQVHTYNGPIVRIFFSQE